MDKHSLLELLADNQLGELFDALKHKQGYYKDLILLESQWNDLRTKQRNDLISNEAANVELGQIRSSLLDLIELSERQSVPVAAQTLTTTNSKRAWMLGAAAFVGLLFLYGIYRFAAAPDSGDATSAGSLPVAPPGKAAVSSRPLDVTGAQPLTVAAGDAYYERVYTLVKTAVESTGGGKSLITLTVGFNFKGSINEILSSDKFRLFADELPGPLAPVNYIGVFANSRSYVEGDIKFELSDEIRRFTIIIEGKEDKKWVFSR